MPFVATKLTVNHKTKIILKDIAKSRTLPLCQVQRASIILSASKNRSNSAISKDLGISVNVVSKWRMHWVKNAQIIEDAEQKTYKELETLIYSLLKDKPRPGAPCNFTEEQILRILEMACRRPTEFGWESSHWSLPQLAKTSVKLGIVDSISPASVSRFLKDGRYQTSQDKILATFNG